MSRFRVAYDPDYEFEKGEVNSGVDKVERGVYISVKERVESMMVAGSRLDASRAENYDLQENEEDDFSREDPTRKPGFDMADAHALEMASQAAIERLEEAQKAEAEVEAKKVKEAEKKALKDEVLKEIQSEQNLQNVKAKGGE